MPPWLKLALVALAAFGLGFVAARRLPAIDSTPASDLAWERTGDTVRLTAKTPGESYLIVEENLGKVAPSRQDSKLLGSSALGPIQMGGAITVESTIRLYRFHQVLSCSHGECNPCLAANDCPPLPGINGPGPIPPPIGWNEKLWKVKGR